MEVPALLQFRGLLAGAGGGDDALLVSGHATAKGVAPSLAAYPQTVITDFETGLDRLLVGGLLVSDLQIMQDGGTHGVATFDGEGTVTGMGAGRVRTGEGDDVIALDNGATGAVTVFGGGGADRIFVDARDGSVINLEDEPFGQGAADDLTLFADADTISDGPATIININSGSSDTIEIRIEAALSGPVTWVNDVADRQTTFVNYVGIRIGRVEVARLPGSASEWRGTPT